MLLSIVLLAALARYARNNGKGMVKSGRIKEKFTEVINNAVVNAWASASTHLLGCWAARARVCLWLVGMYRST